MEHQISELKHELYEKEAILRDLEDKASKPKTPQKVFILFT